MVVVVVIVVVYLALCLSAKCKLETMLRATMAYDFSSLVWPHGSAPAALASLLFDPPEPQIIGKHSVLRLCYLFARLHLLSSHSFSSLIFSLLLFSSLTLPTSAFPSVHIVGSLTAKLPSIMVQLTNEYTTLSLYAYIYIYTYIYIYIYMGMAQSLRFRGPQILVYS